jgi:hypothetical protein
VTNQGRAGIGKVVNISGDDNDEQEFEEDDEYGGKYKAFTNKIKQ